MYLSKIVSKNKNQNTTHLTLVHTVDFCDANVSDFLFVASINDIVSFEVYIPNSAMATVANRT